MCRGYCQSAICSISNEKVLLPVTESPTRSTEHIINCIDYRKRLNCLIIQLTDDVFRASLADFRVEKTRVTYRQTNGRTDRRTHL